ncbi:MAG: hypothetical protein AAF502_21135 [Bacteroidota bacterium]
MMDKEELIQDYLANRLSEEDKVLVDNLLKTDREFQKLYASHLELSMAFRISSEKALKKQLQELDASMTTESLDNNIKKSNFGLLRRLAIAAIFILGVFIGIDQFRADNDVFDSYYEICPNTYLPITRGETNTGKEYEVFKAYENGYYATAETNFEEILRSKNDLNIRFYYAMTLLNQDKYDLALAELKTLTDQTYDYQIESLWYAALIQIKKQDYNVAKEYLLKLRSLNSSYKSQEIPSILKAIQ